MASRCCLRPAWRWAIISGRHAASVERRMADWASAMPIWVCRINWRCSNSLRARLGVDAEQVAYVGDDLIDLPVMTRVGLAIAVQDADPFVKQHAHWQTPSCGGRGAARDVCELLLEARGQLAALRGWYL